MGKDKVKEKPGYDITERRHVKDITQHLAYYDLLTDLPNRILLRHRLDEAILAASHENWPLALLIMDLDRFKEINNTLGHKNGDNILRQIGERLQEEIRDAYTIARLGGDEFAVLLLEADAEVAARTADKIIKRLREPFNLEGLSLDISCSIGITLYPGHGGDADTLIRRADMAMYTAKETESGYTIYSPQYDQYSPNRLALMGELRCALEKDQLFLLYQPKIDLKNSQPIGVEALVRWQHPKLGVIQPDQFITLAEKTGMIKHLTLWVLKEALRQSRSWHQEGLEISVAINISMQNLKTPQLLDQIKGLLLTWGVSPSRLRLEITESTIMADPERTMEILTQLTIMGIRFSIDDFGTGYSSLGYLKRLPVDEIKIDKSFVIGMIADESNAVIVHSIIDLAHNLGLKVVAEGVENQEILDRLISLGCDAAQGYLLSRPIPKEELTDWLKRQKHTQGFEVGPQG